MLSIKAKFEDRSLKCHYLNTVSDFIYCVWNFEFKRVLQVHNCFVNEDIKVYKIWLIYRLTARRSSQLFLLFLLFLLFQKESLLLCLKHLYYLLCLLFHSLHWLLFHWLSSVHCYSIFRVFILMMHLLHLIQNSHCHLIISLWFSLINFIQQYQLFFVLTFSHHLLFLLSSMTTQYTFICICCCLYKWHCQIYYIQAGYKLVFVQ
jgi:hypothetical protein